MLPLAVHKCHLDKEQEMTTGLGHLVRPDPMGQPIKQLVSNLESCTAVTHMLVAIAWKRTGELLLERACFDAEPTASL